tara:strand:- start:531 stop:707 length:177 start_codon:yes stop_codon:yes gene_type:complete
MIVNTIKEQAMGILNRKFPKSTIDSIEECATDWSSNQVTTIGLVNFYKAYYNKEYKNH